MPLQAVTLTVSVPSGTRACYVAGNFNGWDAEGAIEMTSKGNNTFSVTLSNVSTSDLASGYKYLSGPAWKYVEKDSSGNEIANRTSYGNPDTVGSWAALYNPDIKETTINVNGYDRKVRVSLPLGYSTSGKTYPVVYMVGVQQRYSAAGSDDAGDDFFGEDSWDAATAAETLQNAGQDGVIMVATYSFVAENIPYAHPDFMGSGSSDAYLSEFISKVMAYVNSTYRTNTDASATTILGADLGGLLSVYAAIKHPDLFGQAVSLSPMLWLNKDSFIALAADAQPNQRFILSYGSDEIDVIKNDVTDLYTALGSRATLTAYQGAIHDDTSWGKAFPTIYPALVNSAYTPASSVTITQANPQAIATPKADIATSSYTFYYKAGSTSVVADTSVAFSLIDNFVTTSGDVIQAQMLVKDIGSSVTNQKVYWNVGRNDASGVTYLSSSVNNVSFSTKKTNHSWLRVIIKSDETLDSKAASSAGFRVVAADETVTMTAHSNHRTDATVAFTGSDKTFTIHYGSVNTETDMGAITQTYSVGADCTQAYIQYYFETNTVEITETAWGDAIDALVVDELSAVPSVTSAGKNSKVTVRFPADSHCTPTMTCSYNFGSSYSVSLTAVDSQTWTANLTDLQSGIYYLSVNAVSGSSTKDNVATIAIKVISSTPIDNQYYLTVNAYDDIDWTAIGRYKANFHTHTSQSFDTKFNTAAVVDQYVAKGYKILGLTDHDYNPYPWELFELFNSESSARIPEQLGILAIPSVELSKDNRNSWEESTGGYFNHHNDFFTGRKGQEFASLRESYAYTNSLGGMQIINHPGQYWSLDNDYATGEKNSPSWHTENFTLYPSLVGLEVYNQGNRRPNDRILWDQVLNITMPDRPVWGYSCDDTHTQEQYFRNYQFMLMPELTVDALKDAMRNGTQYFCYEYTGSGDAKAPRINAISVDTDNHTITIDADSDEIYWYFGTDKASSAANGTRKSTIVGRGATFDYTGFIGSYVRALIKNDYGETCTQPFGFSDKPVSSAIAIANDTAQPTISTFIANDMLSVSASEEIKTIDLYSLSGLHLISASNCGTSTQIDVSALQKGLYLVTVVTATSSQTSKQTK
jgi:predicted alpha/beta superfamily hydrolase